jgi:hypothetical protein
MINPFGSFVGRGIAASTVPSIPALYIPPNAIFAARSDNVTLSGADATAWPDQSGASNDATGVSVTAYPQIDTSTYGRPVIGLTTSQGYLSLPSAIASAILAGNDLPFTIAGVSRRPAADSFLCSFGDASIWLRVYATSTGRLYCRKSDGTTTADAFTSISLVPVDAWFAWAARGNGTSVSLYIDSPTVVTTPGLNVGDCSAAGTAGVIGRLVGGETTAQQLGALVISDAAESDGEVANIMNSLIAWRDLIDP